MAFIQKNFQPIGANARSGFQRPATGGSQPRPAGANSVQAWSYMHPTDSIATIIAAGYFNFLRDIVQSRDVIFIPTKGNIRIQVHFFNTVPKSPATTNVTLDAKKMIPA